VTKVARGGGFLNFEERERGPSLAACHAPQVAQVRSAALLFWKRSAVCRLTLRGSPSAVWRVGTTCAQD